MIDYVFHKALLVDTGRALYYGGVLRTSYNIKVINEPHFILK